MKIVVIGANGGTGQRAVTQALNKGYQVTAYVRRIETVTPMDGLEIIEGQLYEERKLAIALEGADAVFVCLGPKVSLKAFITPQTLMQTNIPFIIKAMKKAHVDRMILLSAFGVGESVKNASVMLRFAMKTMMASIYKDKLISEQMLIESSLEWTIVYPMFLRDNIASGNIEVIPTSHIKKVKGSPKVTRNDVVKVMLDAIGDFRTIKKRLVISSKGSIIK